MKKQLIKYLFMYGSMISSVALMIGISSAGSVCFLWQYQPKEPEGIRKVKKTSAV